ncbi:hypothetical protein J6590_063897 [Homalodisca vitripennis]|nr:hypothetical protein J6590_063897 [Homalodisca vitripennis]
MAKIKRFMTGLIRVLHGTFETLNSPDRPSTGSARWLHGESQLESQTTVGTIHNNNHWHQRRGQVVMRESAFIQGQTNSTKSNVGQLGF